ncbi:type II toxin-antitoxin system PemK/MazF family toxin [Winogradskya humida]|uniref:mRNA interferase MazF n=1 Tax=Winogradskya humida TaxID=113566 RepID=A0ABQ3ZQT6_9ACTN|nr:type II toxin-antitoxin system PemK/MazF family toxin [Actinoplanes humidus]GIE20937.1 hypothetical protein Ahu01nite_040390 [Actinoplanes humidus]
MRRGEIWVVSRLGSKRAVVIVGHDTLTADRDAVLTVPLSDVMPVRIAEPALRDSTGMSVGIARTPLLGQVMKDYLIERRGELAPASVENLDIALRAVLDL